MKLDTTEMNLDVVQMFNLDATKIQIRCKFDETQMQMRCTQLKFRLTQIKLDKTQMNLDAVKIQI